MSTLAVALPEPTPNDAEVVATALETAGIFQAQGDFREALRWLRRAAELAGDAGDDERALGLARFAAELTAAASPAPEKAPPPAAPRPQAAGSTQVLASPPQPPPPPPPPPVQFAAQAQASAARVPRPPAQSQPFIQGAAQRAPTQSQPLIQGAAQRAPTQSQPFIQAAAARAPAQSQPFIQPGPAPIGSAPPPLPPPVLFATPSAEPAQEDPTAGQNLGSTQAFWNPGGTIPQEASLHEPDAATPPPAARSELPPYAAHEALTPPRASSPLIDSTNAGTEGRKSVSVSPILSLGKSRTSELPPPPSMRGFEASESFPPAPALAQQTESSDAPEPAAHQRGASAPAEAAPLSALDALFSSPHTKPQAQAQAPAQPQPQPRPQTHASTRPQPQAQVRPQPEAQSQLRPQGQAQPQARPQPQLQGQAQARPQPQPPRVADPPSVSAQPQASRSGEGIPRPQLRPGEASPPIATQTLRSNGASPGSSAAVTAPLDTQPQPQPQPQPQTQPQPQPVAERAPVATSADALRLSAQRLAVRVSIEPTVEDGVYRLELLHNREQPANGAFEALVVLVDPSADPFSD